ncbi:MAG: hypothetical protein IJF18_03960 [Oscillospiraceae bacterium]|nr:hypothetical protein [Oscillospiraceae bacterium]
MLDYKELYYFLFNGITDIINALQKDDNNMQNMLTIIKLKKLQRDAEELFIQED